MRGCLSFLIVVCCQVEVTVSGRSLVQRSPTDCGVSECAREALIMRRPWSTGGSCTTDIYIYIYIYIFSSYNTLYIYIFSSYNTLYIYIYILVTIVYIYIYSLVTILYIYIL